MLKKYDLQILSFERLWYYKVLKHILAPGKNCFKHVFFIHLDYFISIIFKILLQKIYVYSFSCYHVVDTHGKQKNYLFSVFQTSHNYFSFFARYDFKTKKTKKWLEIVPWKNICQTCTFCKKRTKLINIVWFLVVWVKSKKLRNFSKRERTVRCVSKTQKIAKPTKITF